MLLTSVTSKGQVTIPKTLRQQLGIRKGTKVSFTVVNNHIELRVSDTAANIEGSGFGLLKSQLPAVPVDFDPSELLKP